MGDSRHGEQPRPPPSLQNWVGHVRVRQLGSTLRVRQKEHETGERIAAGATIPSWVDELSASGRTRLLD